MIWEAAVRPFTLNCCTIRRYLRIKIATFRKQTIAGGAYLLESLSDINIFQKLKTLQRYKSIKVEQLLYIYWGSRTAEDFVQTEFFSLFMGNTVSTKLLIWIFQNGRRPTPQFWMSKLRSSYYARNVKFNGTAASSGIRTKKFRKLESRDGSFLLCFAIKYHFRGP